MFGRPQEGYQHKLSWKFKVAMIKAMANMWKANQSSLQEALLTLEAPVAADPFYIESRLSKHSHPCIQLFAMSFDNHFWKFY